ncbi:MAG: zinc finger domain-containing protein [Candidatus Altiarchaeota archaeon]|nr:zinc finger domain-containing protein [Candidatus Altiarchaeota archaeon]
MERCSSCGTEVMDNYVKFKCPSCDKTEIVRCESCRLLGTKYTCEVCGFVGP